MVRRGRSNTLHICIVWSDNQPSDSDSSAVARMDVFLGDELYKFPSEDLAELEVSYCIE